jgi:hypothetical protein
MSNNRVNIFLVLFLIWLTVVRIVSGKTVKQKNGPFELRRLNVFGSKSEYVFHKSREMYLSFLKKLEKEEIEKRILEARRRKAFEKYLSTHQIGSSNFLKDFHTNRF